MVITTDDALATLARPWDALAASVQSPLLEHAWFEACAHAFPHDGLRIVAVHEAGQVVGIAPLTVDRARRRLAILGAAALYEPTDWLFASRAALNTLIEAVITLGEPCVLERIPANGSLAVAIGEVSRTHAMTITQAAGASHGVSLAGTWHDYLERLSARTRRAFERQGAALHREVGAVTTATTWPKPLDVADVLAQLARLEGSGWKGRHGSTLSQRPDLRRFFERYCHAAAARRTLRVTTLTVGGNVAAMELAVQAYGRVWGLKIAHAEPLSRYAPALQVVHASIAQAFAQQLQAYEFLGAAEAWQERWKPECRPLALALLYPLTVSGLVTAGLDANQKLSRYFRRPPSMPPAKTGAQDDTE